MHRPTFAFARPVVLAIFILAAMVNVPAASTRAAEITAADLLPGTTVVYAEVLQPKQLMATVLDHQLTKTIQASPDYQAATKAKKFQDFLGGVALFEKELGVDWRPAIESLTAGGLHLGFDPATKGAAILIKSGDAALLEKFRDTFIRLARADATNKGKPDPVHAAEYNGVRVFRVGEGRFTTIDQWLLVTNKDDLGKRLVDQYLGLKQGQPGSDSLAQTTNFADARSGAADDRSAWAFVNVSAIRDAGAAKKLFAGKTDNPGAEILVGGILDTLVHTPYATATAWARPDKLAVSLSVPHNAEWTSEAREYFFGEGGKGAAPALLRPKQTLLTLSTYRDLAAMWASADELLNENAAAKISQAESNLSNLFSGRDFGSEVLGAAGAGLQFVLARQTYEGANLPKPSIKLPAGALVVKLTDPDMGRQFKVSFQSLIGLVNFGQSQKGLPQFELSSEKRDNGEIISAAYFVDDKEKEKDGEGKIQYNFSPTIAIVKDTLIMSSAKSLASELMGLVDVGAAVDAAANVNTQIAADLQSVRAILEDNREHLVAQNMLEKGHDRAAAEKEIGGFLFLLGYLRDASLRLTNGEQKLELNVEVNIKGS